MRPVYRPIAALLAIFTLITPAAADDPPATIIHVDDIAFPVQDGTSWNTAFRSLEDAIASIDTSTPRPIEIRIGQGRFTPQDQQDGFDSAFLDAAIVGGFAGFGAPNPDEFNPDIYKTILSGDILQNDPPIEDFAPRDHPAFDDNAVILFEGTRIPLIKGVTLERARVGILGFPRRIEQCTFRGHLAAALGNYTFQQNTGGLSAFATLSVFVRSTIIGCDFDMNNGNATVAVSFANFSSPPEQFVVFQNCRFRRNRSTSYAGVFANEVRASAVSFVIFEQCQFIANVAAPPNDLDPNLVWGAGAIFSPLTPVRVYNSLFYANEVPFGEGAAITSFPGRFFGADPQRDRPVIQNSILWNNQSEFGDGPTGTTTLVNGNAGIVYRNNIIEGWTRAGESVPADGVNNSIFQNVIDADPLFVDPEGPDGILGTDDDDFTLAPTSPAIDAGTTEVRPEELINGLPLPFTGTDAAGNPRIADDSFAAAFDPANPIDIGPFELTPTQADRDNNAAHDAAQIANQPTLDFDTNGLIDTTQPFIDCNNNDTNDAIEIALNPTLDCDADGVLDGCQIAADPSLDADNSGTLDACEPTTLFVDDDANPGGDGSSWSSPFTSLEYALAIAAQRSARTQIRVAQGTYTPDHDFNRYSSFDLPADTHVYGGYAGVNDPDPNLRDTELFETILSGLIPDTESPGDTARVLHTVTVRGVQGPAPSIDGVTITDGSGDSVGGLLFSLLLATPDGNVLNRNIGAGAIRVAQSSLTTNNITLDNNAGNVIAHAGTLGNATLTMTNTAITGGQGISEIFVAAIGPLNDVIAAASNVGRPTIVVDGVTSNTPMPITSLAPISTGDITITGHVRSPSAAIALPNTAPFLNPIFELGDVTIDAPQAVLVNNDDAEFRTGVSLYITGQVDIIDGNLELAGSRTPENLNIEQAQIRANAFIFDPPQTDNEDDALTIRNSTIIAGSVNDLAANERRSITNTVIALDTPGTQAPWSSPSAFNDAFQYTAIINADTQSVADAQQFATDNAIPQTNIFPTADAFTDPAGPDAIPRTGDEDYTPAPGSPLIDAGSNTLSDIAITTDLAGNPRFTDDPATPDTGEGNAPIIDIGAREFQPFQPACPADTNNDNTVGPADLVQLLANFGQAVANGPADGDVDPFPNGDGTVTPDDLFFLLANFGTTCP